MPEIPVGLDALEPLSKPCVASLCGFPEGDTFFCSPPVLVFAERKTTTTKQKPPKQQKGNQKPSLGVPDSGQDELAGGQI